MPEVQSPRANYCPVCGAEVATAETVVVDADLATTGTFERKGAHAVVEAGQIRLFEHAGGGG